MPREFARRDRVAEEIKKELGDLITTRVKDPAVRLVTITDVDVSPDLKHAKIYVGMFDILGSGDQAAEVLAGLQRARGFLRHALGQRMRLRVLPELRFYEDATERKAQQLEQVIRAAVAEDERGQSAGAAADDHSRHSDDSH